MLRHFDFGTCKQFTLVHLQFPVACGDVYNWFPGWAGQDGALFDFGTCKQFTLVHLKRARSRKFYLQSSQLISESVLNASLLDLIDNIKIF